jgi:transcriptional regulator
MKNSKVELLQGTLEMLILKSLSNGSLHGYDVVTRIRQMSDDVLTVQEGSLYPALHRMEERGLIESEWGLSENNRRAKYYKLTKAGRKQLENETADWAVLSKAISKVMQTA